MDTPRDAARTPRTPLNQPTRTSGDHGMLRATVIALIVAIALDSATIVLAGLMYDGPALLGAVVGTVLTLVIVLPTVAIAYLAPRLGAASMALSVLGTWGGKMVIVIAVLILLRDVQQVSLPWIGIALLVGALCAVAVEMILLVKVRQPLQVLPPSGTNAGAGDE